MKGCKAKPELKYQPVFFTEEQAALISELSEIIIPKTDTPGAKETGVPAFIDGLIKEVYTTEAKENFLKGLTAFNEDAIKDFGDDFISCTGDQRIALVKKHHDAALAASNNDGSIGWWRAGGKNQKPFIIEMKEWTLAGFFTSETGATQTLQYNQVPGVYRGCVPLGEVGKAWAT